MMTITHQTTLAAIGMMILAGCSPKLADQNNGRYGTSKVASITMPVPDKIKSLIAPGKIDAYSLSITPGACDNGVTGTTISKIAAEMTTGGINLPSEKIPRGCAYTIILSMGKANTGKTALDKIYLTNDVDGKRIQLTADQTRVDAIKTTALLQVTDDAKKDLGIDDLGNSVNPPVPTSLVSFEKDVKPIMASSCLSCHSAGASSPTLVTYDDVKSKYDRIMSEINSGDMPKHASKLASDKIDTLTKWGVSSGGQTSFQP